MSYLIKIDDVKKPRDKEFTLWIPSRVKRLQFTAGPIVVLPPPIPSLVVPSNVIQRGLLWRRRWRSRFYCLLFRCRLRSFSLFITVSCVVSVDIIKVFVLITSRTKIVQGSPLRMTPLGLGIAKTVTKGDVSLYPVILIMCRVGE